jgi:hypothetical protein
MTKPECRMTKEGRSPNGELLLMLVIDGSTEAPQIAECGVRIADWEIQYLVSSIQYRCAAA